MKPNVHPCIIAIALFCSIAAARSFAQTVVYSEDFETRTSFPEWTTLVSNPPFQNPIRTDVTPIGSRRFLGQFGRQTLSLILRNLPRHDSIAVEFDLFLIRSWDGSVPDDGDEFRLTETNTRYLWCATFSNFANRPQTYPDVCTSTTHPGQTGAVERGTLGYTFAPYGAVNSVQHIRLSIGHIDSILRLHFIGGVTESRTELGNLDNESWGIDNVTIRLVQNDVAAAIPSSLLFDTLSCGVQRRDSTIWIRSVGEVPLRIDTMVITGPDAASFTLVSPVVFPITLAKGDSIPCIVRFQPAAPGTFNALLEVRGNGSGGLWTIDLAGGRETIALSLSSHMVDFGVLCAESMFPDTSIVVANAATVATTYRATAGGGVMILSGGQGQLGIGESGVVRLRFAGGRGAGDYRDTLLIADACGVIDTVVLRVRIRAQPRPTLPGVITLCPGMCDSIDAGQHAGYRWSTGATSRRIGVCDSGRYSVVVIDSSGCASRPDTVTVQYLPLPSVLVSSNPACTCDTIRLTAPPGYVAYRWSGGDTTRSILVREQQPGEYSYVVTVTDTNGCTATSPVQRIRVVAPVGRMEVTPEVVSGGPGDTVLVSLRLFAPEALGPCGMSTYRAGLRYNRSLLYPLFGSGIIEGADRDGRFTRLSLSGRWPMAPDTLIALPFRVMLGDTTGTTITFDTITSGACAVQNLVVGGEFRLTGVCREGTMRLLDVDGGIELKQVHPNPVRDRCAIELRVMERGTTKVVVDDMLGRRVATLYDGEMLPGLHVIEFNAASLPAGAYLCRLVTPSMTISRSIQIHR